MAYDDNDSAKRCGKRKRHSPHWWGDQYDKWCDGRHYEPSQQMIEKSGKQMDEDITTPDGNYYDAPGGVPNNPWEQ
jgi:hypothetical protein